MNERALVLGGGGGSGNAWLIGVIAGLFDEGLDVREADLVVGTSAGSTAAAQIMGASPRQLFADIMSIAPPQRAVRTGSDSPSRPSPADHMSRTGLIISDADGPEDMRRAMGAALLDVDEGSDGARSRQWQATVASRLPRREWPACRLLITAVDARSGEPVVFDRDSGVDLIDAVAASTAGGFAYTIGDKQYIDGGYRTDVNADLAAGYGRVLIIPPLGHKTRKPPEWGLHLEAQVEELQAGGSNVECVCPDGESEQAIGIGMDLMDLARRRPSAEAGFSQGKALAERLGKFWH